MNILINGLGIQDSGGITVLAKLLDEIKSSTKDKFFIVCNFNEKIKELSKKYQDIEMIEFIYIYRNNFLYRLYFENIIFKKLIKNKLIDLVYNFTGTSQFFLNIPQITKIHNLLFYSKKLEEIYFNKKKYITWFKQVYIKRFILIKMLKYTNYIEVQSEHVKNSLSDFLDVSKKIFFIKSDINVEKELFLEPKNYDFRQKIKFLYIVGPHFEYLHKNFETFLEIILELQKNNLDFEILITLTKEELNNSIKWDSNLNVCTKFLGYLSKEELYKYFDDNTILVSTSIIETLGLPVIEAIQNGVIAIVPNEEYSYSVYGNKILTYNLLNVHTFIEQINDITKINVKDLIYENQIFLIENETNKVRNIINIFYEILKDKNV